MSAPSLRSSGGSPVGNDAQFAFGPSPSITAPSGGGSLRSMGDSFAMNNATGTGTYTIPIAVTPGRSAAETSLSLSYSSGGGNGIFGLGWSHSFDISVSRKTNPSLPQYRDAEDSDTFVLSGYGDLVPCLVRTNSEYDHVYIAADEDYVVKRYRPRLERSFSKIEFWTKKSDPNDTHWRVYSPDNELSIFGRDENNRVFARDETGSKIFSWLLAEQYDCMGNGRRMIYKPENSINVNIDQACELHRTRHSRSSARYLKSILYGNREPAAFVSLGTTSDAKFMFEIVFDYGEHHASNPTTQETQPWPVRSDPFSSYRSGFELRYYRQCRRILMFHHIPEELGREDYLVNAAVLTYDGSAHASHLLSWQHIGYVADTSTEYRTQSLPPLQFEYTAVPTRQQLCDAPLQMSEDEESFTNFAAAGSASSTWIDLLGEGIPGVLASEGGEWYYKQNLSPSDNDLTSARDQSKPMRLHLDVLSIAAARPLQHGQGMTLTDVGANGSLDLLCDVDGMHGFFRSRANAEHSTAIDIGWDDYQPFASSLTVGQSDFVRSVDLTGDGTPDLLLLLDSHLIWYPSLGEKGYGPAQHLSFGSDDSEFSPLMLAQDSRFIHLSDMSGDGLVDLVYIRNGVVCYWPNLGHGNFGSVVHMDDCPIFDDDFTFSSTNILLCDIDGSGTTDLVYNRNGVITVYLNSSGNAFEAPIVLAARIPQTQSHTVTTIDLFGNGTACLVWSTDLPSHPGRASLAYIDFTNGVKPHLLCNISSGAGCRTELIYRPSTSYYCQDKDAGRPWITKLPFPVHCVDSVTKHDLVTGRRFVQRFSYHHGTYDHHEREFAGFAMVEQWDAEEAIAMTDNANGEHWQNGLDTQSAHTKTWYHTGIFTHHDTLTRRLVEEFYGASTHDAMYDTLLQDKITYDAGDLNVEEARQATYALRGSVLRQELGAINGIPYTITDHCSTVKVLQPHLRAKIAVVTFVSESETLVSTLEQQHEIPARTSHTIVIERDQYGRPMKEAHIQYGRRDVDSRLSKADQDIQRKTSIRYTQTTFSNEVDRPGQAYRLPKPLRVQVYELDAPVPQGSRYEPAEIPTPGPQQIISDTEVQYRTDNLMFVGEKLEALAIPGAAYRLCMTSQMIEDFQPFGETITPAMRRENLIAEGGYVDHKQDGNLWAKQSAPTYHADPSASPTDERKLAKSSFYSIRRVLDSFGNASLVEWDPYFLAPKATIDALGDRVTGSLDYRILQMSSIVDVNGNRKQVVFDALGGVTALATSGKDGKGDSIDGLDIQPTEEQIDEFFEKPTTHARALLGQATTRFITDHGTSSDDRGRTPVRIAQISRERHASDAKQSPLTIQVQYMDGLGRLLQTKTLAEPDRATPNSERWRCSAWSVVNNKGLVVEQFEPFFDVSAAFVPRQKHGVSTLHVYDALDREVVTILPNATWTKQHFTPWSTVHYDPSDTLEMPLSKEPQVQSVLASIPLARYSPSWLEQRLSAPDNTRDKQTATQSKAYGCTPAWTFLDAKSRPFLQRKTLAGSNETYVRTIFDHNDQPLQVQDTGSRIVSVFTYDMAQRQTHHQSIDSGQRWTLCAASGEILRQYDGRGQRLRYEYDSLRRNTAVFCRRSGTSAVEYMMSKTVYGDKATYNAKGRIVQHMDQSGLTSTPHWDLNGNCLSKEIRLTEAYSDDIDWQRAVKLQDRRYTTAARYDALGRVTSSIAPDETVTRTTYLTGGHVDEICVNVRSEKDAKGWKWRAVCTSRQYDAHGRMTSEVQGNGILVSMEFDRTTQQVSRKTVTKAGVVLHDIQYTRDVNHDIVYVSRTSQLASIARLQGSADSEYEYDSRGRLIKASGREDVGLTDGRPDAPGNTFGSPKSTGMKRFTETYVYDAYSNMTSLDHRIDDAKSPGWSRKMTYGTQTMQGQTFTGNRLVSSSVGKLNESYTYDESGNTISMPHMSKVEWDVSNQMRSSSVQVTTSGVPETTWYVYNSAGQRVRKVTERSRRSADESARKLSEHVYIDEYDLYQEFSGAGEVRKACESVRVEEDDSPAVTIEHWSHLNKPLMRFLFKNDQESISLELDENGREISYEEYSAFGSTTYSRSTKDVPKPFRYATKRRDRESGLYYYGGRYYVPWLCRWMSPDPSGLVDGTNTYLYCGANPTNYTDPDGNAGVPFGALVTAQSRALVRYRAPNRALVPYRERTSMSPNRPQGEGGSTSGGGETRLTVRPPTAMTPFVPKNTGLVPRFPAQRTQGRTNDSNNAGSRAMWTAPSNGPGGRDAVQVLASILSGIATYFTDPKRKTEKSEESEESEQKSSPQSPGILSKIWGVASSVLISTAVGRVSAGLAKVVLGVYTKGALNEVLIKLVMSPAEDKITDKLHETADKAAKKIGLAKDPAVREATETAVSVYTARSKADWASVAINTSKMAYGRVSLYVQQPQTPK